MVTRSNSSVGQFRHSRPAVVQQERAGNRAGALFFFPFRCIMFDSTECLLCHGACILFFSATSPLSPILGSVARPGT